MSSQHDDKPGFLARWSQRKLQSEAAQDTPAGQTPAAETPADEADKPLWQQDNADDDIRQAAMAALFRQPEFQQADPLNEYDEDYTYFSKLGDVVTHEMKRMWKLAEENTRPERVDDKQQASDPGSEAGEKASA